jgi:hypothetical protein
MSTILGRRYVWCKGVERDIGATLGRVVRCSAEAPQVALCCALSGRSGERARFVR